MTSAWLATSTHALPAPGRVSLAAWTYAVAHVEHVS
jgi:hypothetical protein